MSLSQGSVDGCRFESHLFAAQEDFSIAMKWHTILGLLHNELTPIKVFEG